MVESSPYGRKTPWYKEKLLVMSNFSFYLRAFKRLVLQTCRNMGLSWKGLKVKLLVRTFITFSQTSPGFYISAFLDFSSSGADKNMMSKIWTNRVPLSD